MKKEKTTDRKLFGFGFKRREEREKTKDFGFES